MRPRTVRRVFITALEEQTVRYDFNSGALGARFVRQRWDRSFSRGLLRFRFVGDHTEACDDYRRNARSCLG